MEELLEKLITEVKVRLGINSTSKDKEIFGYLKDFINKIRSICNREDLPEKLEYLAINYAMNCIKFYEKGYGEGKRVVSSATDNGQSVTFKDVGTISSDDVNINKYIEKNKDEISMYAYIGW